MMLKKCNNNNTQLHITVKQTLIKVRSVIIDIKNINGDRSEGGGITGSGWMSSPNLNESK